MIAHDRPYTVVLDTCVLAPMPLCDTLLRMAEGQAFYIPRWSDDILRELRSTLLRMGYTTEQVTRRISAMTKAFEDARVAGYTRFVTSMTNDPKDRHVLAAAVRCVADAIVTANVKHFPAASVRPYQIAVLTPDEFLVRQFHLAQDLVLKKIEAQAGARGVAPRDLLLRLAKSVPRFAALCGARL